MRTINLVKGELNDRLRLSTVLLTMYDGRTRLAAQVAEEVRAHFAAETLPTVIPRSVRISEAPSYGQSVLTYHPDSAGAVSYLRGRRGDRPTAAPDGATDEPPAPNEPRARARAWRAVPAHRLDRHGIAGRAGRRRAADRRLSAGRSRIRRCRSRGLLLRRAADRVDHARTRASRARCSTRTPWPSWSTRSGGRPAAAGCRPPLGGRPVRAGDGRAALAGHPGGRPADRSRPSSGRPRTTTCCATRCWRTCTGPSSTRWKRRRRTSSCWTDFGCTQDELASRIKRSRPQISNTLRLLRLPPTVQRRVAAGVLSAGHARALLA